MGENVLMFFLLISISKRSIYIYRGPHGRLAVTLCSYVFAKCSNPL